MNIKKSTLTTFSFLLIYKFLLDLSYVIFVNPNYEYMGFILDFSTEKYFISFLCFIITFISLPKDESRPSTVFSYVLFIVSIMPMYTIYAFMNQATKFMVFTTIAFMVQCLILVLMPRFHIVRIRNSKYFLYCLLGGITAFVYLSMIRANGIPSLNRLNFLSVYEWRRNVKYPFLMNYLVVWQAKIINPFLITTSFLSKRKFAFVVSVFLELLLYLIAGHKTYLFISVAIVLVTMFIDKFHFGKISSKMASLGVAFLLIWHLITKDIVLASSFIRRFLMVPAQIRFFYYDFFSKEGFTYFATNTIGSLFGVTNEYTVPVPVLISDIYYNAPNGYANTGYIGDAYMNLGFLGMLIFCVVLGLIFKLIDSLSIKIGKELVVGLSIFSVLTLNDGALLTNLLNGGMLFLLLILYLYSGFSNKK